MVILLIRYNELGLKSPRVRSRFQKQLIRNIEDKFLREQQDCFIDPEWGRIYLQTDDIQNGIRILRTIFGLASVSPVITCDSELGSITNTTVDYAKTILNPGQSFALRTRRIGKHTFTSMSLAEHVGSELLKELAELDLSVNLTKPDAEIFIEVRRRSAYVFSEKYSGPGGLPLGTQGKVVCIFSDPNSYIASWLMMKRGCRIYPVCFTHDPAPSTQVNRDEYLDQLELLTPWVSNLKFKTIDITTNGKDEHLENKLSIGLQNNEFYKHLNRTSAKGVCLSINLNGLSKLAFDTKLDVPLFFPMIGLDKSYIKKLGDKIRKV